MPAEKPGIRVSDQERSDAMSALGAHFAQGRLDIVEYEERITTATAARSRHELDELFYDLPPLTAQADLVPFYSAAEIEKAHQRGAKPKLGITLLSIIVALAGIIATSAMPNADAWGAAFVLLPPAVFVLLYVMKVGPESWHAPSPKQLDRQRLAALRAEHRFQKEQQRQLRRQKTDQLQQQVLRYAEKRLFKN